jgi:hypothetical protein
VTGKINEVATEIGALAERLASVPTGHSKEGVGDRGREEALHAARSASKESYL